MGRLPCCEKVGLNRGRWTTEEDEKLTKYIEANGEGSWKSLPKKAGLLRCGKSCRLRWVNYLRSDLKRESITSEEEDVIIKLHASLGNRWSIIASHLRGRTDNEIKNYWNSHLSRKIFPSWQRTVNDAAPINTGVTKLDLPPRRKGGRKRKGQMTKTNQVETTADQIAISSTVELEKAMSSEVLCEIGIFDELLDLEWFLSEAECVGNKNEGTQNACIGEDAEIGNLECNTVNFDSDWDWESVFQNLSNEDQSKQTLGNAELEAAESQYHDAIKTWLLS